MRSALALIAIAGCLFGCRTPTSITLSITTDVKCSDLKGVSISTGNRASFEAASPVTTTTQCTTVDAKTSRIGTLVVVPSGGSDDEVSIRIVAGLDRPVEQCKASDQYQGCIVARRFIRFQSHVELQLPIELQLDCKSVACDATSTCVNAGCRSATVDDPECVGPDCLFPVDDASTADAPDAPGDAPAFDAPVETCASGTKVCGDGCKGIDDPAFGCGATTCSPCGASGDHRSYTCMAGACVQGACTAGFKDCAGACVAKDAAHGCDAASCSACPSTNGVASCAGGACQLACNSGYKLCGGVCVSVDDPNFGCGPTSCSKAGCPTGGTIVCSSGACVIGTCGAGTKNCGGSCVPTDAAHGCQDVARCTACGAGESCTGSPTACACVPESKSTTCSKVECGVTTNNCGASVDCGNTCAAPKSCGGGGVGNKCGCTPSGSPCNGVSCGTLTDSCGTPVTCTCTSPKTCSGGTCSCTPTSNNCGFKSCGSGTDNCGNPVSCGTCPSGSSCRCGGECISNGAACP